MSRNDRTQNDNVSSGVRDVPKGIGSESELDTDLSSLNENEGEGSRSAGRRYNEATEQYIQSGKVGPSARKAADALDSDEGNELREAEEKAKQGISDWGGHQR